MQKLKIRQYWTKQTNKPWYVIRYGDGTYEYLTSAESGLKSMIKTAIICGKYNQAGTNG